MAWRKDRDTTTKGAILRGVFEANYKNASGRTPNTSGAGPKRNSVATAVSLLGFVLFLCSPSDQEATFVHTRAAQANPLQSAGGRLGRAPSPLFTEPGETTPWDYLFASGIREEHPPAPVFPWAEQGEETPSEYPFPFDGGEDDASVDRADSTLLGEETPSDYRLLFDKPGVRLSALFGLAVRTIVLDPGHGGRDPGALGPAGTREKDLTLDIALRLREHLTHGGKYKIVMTRDSDTTLSLAGRVDLANSAAPDLFVSIHVNALRSREMNAVETYYFGPHTDDDAMQVAEEENRDSEYNLQAFRKIVAKISDTVKRQESINLASSIQRSLYAWRKTYDRNVRNWGTKPAPFVVLLGVDTPAVLAEISCISNPQEETKLNSPEYREQVASCLEQGIRRYLDQKRHNARGGEAHEQEIDG